jgi:exopolysaccharide biosynthesis polyprenyl glycosylphosphotransferase
MTVIKPRVPIGADRVPLRHPARGYDTSASAHTSPKSAHAPSSERTWARHYRARLRITDTTIIVASVGAAFFVRFGFDETSAKMGSSFNASYWVISILIASAWIFALSAYHTRDSRVVGLGVTEYKRVVNASALTFGLLAIVFLVGKVDIARGFFVLLLPAGTVALVLSRWIWRQWLIKQRKFDHYLSRALVVGGLEDVEYVVGQIHQKSGAAYNVVGASVEHAGSSRIAVATREVPVVGGLSDVAAAAARMGVDTVIVAGQPSGGSQFIRNLGWDLEGTATELVLASRLTDVAGPRIHFRPVEGLPLIHVEIPQFEGGKHVLKRAFDILVTTFALILSAPLFLAIAIAIKLDDHGPVFFSQERVGRNGATFRMYKFRSMVQNAELDLATLMDKNEGSGLLFKMKNDPRVTAVGHILRKYSLDELPQLLNVFFGDMSLVGPRPPLPKEVQGYETHVHRRLYIKPGLTGMWQVNGRSDLSWDESVRLDLYYVENWSLTGDLVIMWRTVKVLTHPVGAY